MKLEEYEEIRRVLKLTEQTTAAPSLLNLNCITTAALYTFPYSDLSIHAPDAPETALNWETIFERLVRRSLPGCCYERGEVLFRLLEHLGYETVRLEVRCVSKGEASPYRHEHMALAVRLDREWHLVDSAWAQVFPGQAIKLENGHVTETPRMMIRTVHASTRKDENVKSSLDASLMRQWDVEYLSPRVEYDDHREEQPTGKWKIIFTFDFERQQLDNFKQQCHRMHHDENQFCKLNSLLAWNDTVEHDGTMYSRHTMIVGHEQVETVKRFRVYDNVRQINEMCEKHKVKIEHENWKPRSMSSLIRARVTDCSN